MRYKDDDDLHDPEDFRKAIMQSMQKLNSKYREIKADQFVWIGIMGTHIYLFKN